MEGYFTLSNGIRMPAIGFGTWSITPDDAAEKAVVAALKAGYRQIDTAKLYANEIGVGKGVRSSGVAREDIFVTTKLWNDAHAYGDAHRAFEVSREKLGLDYVDLYLIHWPQEDDADHTWPAMLDIYNSGKAKAIGISNFDVDGIQAILDRTDTPPMVNQIELHPYNYRQQKHIIEFCHANGIVVQAYSPLSRHSSTGGTELIEKMAQKYGKTSSQVILRWCLQHDAAPLPRSTNPSHLRENIDIFDFELEEADMQAMDRLS